jgi:hypothetical protein
VTKVLTISTGRVYSTYKKIQQYKCFNDHIIFQKRLPPPSPDETRRDFYLYIFSWQKNMLRKTSRVKFWLSCKTEGVNTVKYFKSEPQSSSFPGGWGKEFRTILLEPEIMKTQHVFPQNTANSLQPSPTVLKYWCYCCYRQAKEMFWPWK